MSANDKAAATYGRQPMTIAETLLEHDYATVTYGDDDDFFRCVCGETGDTVEFAGDSDEWLAAHQSAMLEPLIVGREHEASRQAFTDATNALTEAQAGAWALGYTSGHSRAMRRMSDEPAVEPGTNPYRARAEQ